MLQELAHAGHGHGEIARPNFSAGAIRGQGQPGVTRGLGAAGRNPWRKGSDEDPVRCVVWYVRRGRKGGGCMSEARKVLCPEQMHQVSCGAWDRGREE